MINLCPVCNSTTDLGRLGDGCNRYRCRPSVVRPHCIAKIVVSPLSTPTPRHSLPVTNLALSLYLCFCLSLSHSSQLQDVRTGTKQREKNSKKAALRRHAQRLPGSRSWKTNNGRQTSTAMLIDTMNDRSRSDRQRAVSSSITRRRAAGEKGGCENELVLR